MLTVELARDLLAAGVLWSPAEGDRFCLPDRGMDDDVFWIAEMTVSVHDLPRGRVVGFNGVTEWALDSVRVEDALWLPREDQLRALLGLRFRRLERVAGRYAVVVACDGPEERYEDDDVECAYARALLAVARG